MCTYPATTYIGIFCQKLWYVTLVGIVFIANWVLSMSQLSMGLSWQTLYYRMLSLEYDCLSHWNMTEYDCLTTELSLCILNTCVAMTDICAKFGTKPKAKCRSMNDISCISVLSPAAYHENFYL